MGAAVEIWLKSLIDTFTWGWPHSALYHIFMKSKGGKGKPNPTWNIWNTWNIQNTTNIFVYIFEYSENSSPNN